MEKITLDQAIKLILDELYRSEKIHPIWPEDVVYGACILGEETGSALKAALDIAYNRGDQRELIKEIAHSGAMAIRFLINLKK